MFQLELKNAYIGEVYEYSYDFTKGSISDLTNQWWTWLSNCSINTTYWLTSSTSWDTPLLSQPKLTSVLSSAKKIKIAYTCYKWTTWNTTQRWFWFLSNWTNDVWIYWDGSAIQLRLWWTLYVNTTSSQSVGTYNFSLDIDLTTKKAVYSWITSWTYTITDSDIATIRTGDTLRIAVSSNSYIKNVSILVE